MSHRNLWSMLLLTAMAASSACKGNSEEAGLREAQREAEAEAKRLGSAAPAAPRQRAPVTGSRKLDCNQLIDMTAFREALGEKEPLSMRDVSKGKVEANASCSLLRGGRTPTPREQEAIIKRTGKLGVIPGDELCNITALCNTIEEEERFKKRCGELHLEDDESMGSYACVKMIPHGGADVKSFRFLDPETRCVIEVRGGPSMEDNDFITACAKAARDLIGPAQIAEVPAGTTPAGEPEIIDTVETAAPAATK
jgi:hypothetical protein